MSVKHATSIIGRLHGCNYPKHCYVKNHLKNLVVKKILSSDLIEIISWEKMGPNIIRPKN